MRNHGISQFAFILMVATPIALIIVPLVFGVISLFG